MLIPKTRVKSQFQVAICAQAIISKMQKARHNSPLCMCARKTGYGQMLEGIIYFIG
jgi:hypothetical protein